MWAEHIVWVGKQQENAGSEVASLPSHDLPDNLVSRAIPKTSTAYTPFRLCRPVLCSWLSKKYPSIELKSVSE